MSDQNTMEDRINQKTDLAVAGATEVSTAVGGLAFKDMSQVMEFAKLMSVSRQAVPKHLRDQPGTCLAVSLQALNWRMDPFAVANKSYSVNDRVAYEAQLIQAVIEQRAPIKGRIKGSFEGEGPKRVCVLRVVSAEDGDEIEYRSPEIGQIKVKNSPLWQADPDQQLWYYSARAMCRRHFPDVLLGVYEKEEIMHSEGIKDVTPEPSGFAAKALAARKAAEAPEDAEDAEEVAPDTEDQGSASHWTESVDLSEAFPGSQHWTEGEKAHAAALPRTTCPYHDDPTKAADWLAAWDAAAEAGA